MSRENSGSIMGAAHSAELSVMSPIALKPLLAKVAEDIENSGTKLSISWGESATIKSDIEKGTAFDIAILTPNFVDDLIRQGKLDGTTRTAIATSGLGVAVRKGAQKPDIGTTDAFKRTLLSAASIGIVEHSASSRYVTGLFARLGITEDIKGKLKPLPGPAAPFVAKGDAEIAITQISAIVPFEGVELAGPLPKEIQLYTTFTAAARPIANLELANSVLKALVSPEHSSLLKKIGLEPAS